VIAAEVSWLLSTPRSTSQRQIHIQTYRQTTRGANSEPRRGLELVDADISTSPPKRGDKTNCVSTFHVGSTSIHDVFQRLSNAIILSYLIHHHQAAIVSGWTGLPKIVPRRGLKLDCCIAYSSSSTVNGLSCVGDLGLTAVMVFSIRSSGIFCRSAVDGLSAAVAILERSSGHCQRGVRSKARGNIPLPPTSPPDVASSGEPSADAMLDLPKSMLSSGVVFVLKDDCCLLVQLLLLL
jgi:hypothetical protein